MFMYQFHFIFETAPCYVVQTDFELAIFLFLPHMLGLQVCATISSYFCILKRLIMILNYSNGNKGKVKQCDRKQRGKH